MALLTISHFPKAADAQTAPWIDENAAQQYATDLIGGYDALVDSSQASSQSFPSIAQYFSLYHSAEDSFKVLVVRSTTLAISSNQTDTVAFVFIPIQSPQPQIIVENNETLENLVGIVLAPMLDPGASNGSDIISPLKDGTAFYQYTMSQQGEVTRVPLIWVTSISHEVLNETAANSEDAAHEIYDSDSTWVATHIATQTSQTQTSDESSAPTQNVFVEAIDSSYGPVIPLVVILVGVLVFVWARYVGRERYVAPTG
jgi:hypothetical protein